MERNSQLTNTTNALVWFNDKSTSLVGLLTSSTESPNNDTCHGGVRCIPGLFLPLWHPKPPSAELADRIIWALIFVVVMIYIFVGISMVMDSIAGAVEVIVSQKKTVKTVSRATGQIEYVRVPVWNATVARLTLLAFGSCASEISLSLIEVIAQQFTAGDLGPGTIVGAGAYNLFIIQAICVASVTRGKSKRIQELPIYFITAGWAIFGYLWLFIILVPSSKGIVEVWEALLTLLFFPIMVIMAYLVDRRFFGACSKKLLHKGIAPEIRIESNSESSTPTQTSETSHNTATSLEREATEAMDHKKSLMEKVERRYAEILEEMKIRQPNKTADELHQLAAVALLKELPKGRGYYRMQSTRGISGGGDLINVKKFQEMLDHRDEERTKINIEKDTQTIFFDPDAYSVMENVGVFYVNIGRKGDHLDKIITVEYRTKDGI